MRAAVVAIGDEIVTGRIADTNSRFLCDTLTGLGFEVARIVSVPDDRDGVAAAVADAASAVDLIVCTGGLGPTADDLTTEAVASAFGLELELHEESLARIRDRFRQRGLDMPESNRKQALLPRGSVVIANERGTAPGFLIRVGRGSPVTVVCLPGVPSEMRALVESNLVPRLDTGVNRFRSRVFSVTGLPESTLGEMTEGIAGGDPDVRVSYRAAFPMTQLTVTVRGADMAVSDARLDRIEAEVLRRLGDHVYDVGARRLEEVVGSILAAAGLTLATAESCTGGLIGHRLTDVPGSSGYYLGGVVAYSNAAKAALLGVDGDALDRHGAVSVEVAEAMAAGARARFSANVSVATTGIAGPGGGSEAKPVGTVCIAVADAAGVWSRRVAIGDRGRDWVKAVTAQLALDALRRRLLSLPMEG